MHKQRVGAGDRAKGASAFVALLRGIYVGGKNMLPMSALVAMFEAAGCAAVESYIQSGNVVFKADKALADDMPMLVGKRITKQFGYEIPIVMRSARELEHVARTNPFLKPGVDINLLYVAFLSERPDARRVAGLDPGRSPPDEFAVIGSEIYLHLRNGAGKTKLTNAYFDSKLATISTMRNWKTTLKLAELTGA